MKGAGDTVHIVILNDNEDLLFLFQQLFQDQGYRVTVTTREERALRVISREHCDLFIQDLNRMDGAGGVALLELMRSSPCFCDVPVVVASTEPMFQAQRAALAALDVIDAIVLPSDHHTLIERVRRAIGRQG